jgi:hypothetical protein
MPATVESFTQCEHTEDEVITTTTKKERRPRRIDFSEILEASQVVVDEDHQETPWDSCVGYDHDTTRRGLDSHDEDRRGFCYADRGAVLITLDTDREDREYHQRLRREGCSRQVAAELVAMDRRARLDQLVKWYSHGWEWWGVRCDFAGESGSLWGIDSCEYAREEVRQEIALEVAAMLEDRGYLIENKPTPPRFLRGCNWTREDQRRMYRRNVNRFNVSDPS